MADKKKRQSTGGKKPSYPKAKPVQGKQTGLKAKASAQAGGNAKGSAKGGSTSDNVSKQWSLITAGSLELKIFLFLVALVAVASFIQYPYWKAQYDELYLEAKKDYPQLLEEWKEKYPTKEKQETNEKSKPEKPIKPTFQLFITYSALMNILMGAMIAFLGINVQRRTDLKTPIMDDLFKKKFDLSRIKDLAMHSGIWAVLGLVPIIISLFVVKMIGISKDAPLVTISAWKNCLNNIYTGVHLQLLLVFLIMSTGVWVFTRYRDKLKIEPHVAGIIVALLLSFLYMFALSRVPGEKLLYAIVTSIAVSISLVGMHGYLYWKKGIEYSLLAGMICLGVTPLIATVVL